MISKTIHYVWVGGTPITPLAQRCIQSWKKHLPEYTIKLWNEENFPHMDHVYIQEMYKKKKWAFVSDYMRFWILYHEGGIYLDADMEVLKKLDSFLYANTFFGKTSDGLTACGVIGAEQGSKIIKRILDVYDADTQYDIKNTSPRIVTSVIKENDKNVTVYNSTVFYPCDDGEKCTKEKLSSAYTNHHWAESWVSWRVLRKIARRIGLMRFIKKFMAPNFLFRSPSQD